LPLGTPTVVVALTTTTTTDVELNAVTEVDLTSTAASAFTYTILVELRRDAGTIFSVTVDRVGPLNVTSEATSEVIPMTWADTPTAASHTYDLQVTVTATGIATATDVSAVINALLFTT
jgi:hypothetical protein